MDKILSKMSRSSVKEFVKTARGIVKREKDSPFSLEDIYALTNYLGIDGLIYLEKFDDRRHVNVVLELGKSSITLYDPMFGVKLKPYNEVQFGMYCKPVGTFKNEFERYEQKLESERSENIWIQYGQKGKMLFNFFNRYFGFGPLYNKSIASLDKLPNIQNSLISSDCAPLSLFIITMCNLP